MASLDPSDRSHANNAPQEAKADAKDPVLLGSRGPDFGTGSKTPAMAQENGDEGDIQQTRTSTELSTDVKDNHLEKMLHTLFKDKPEHKTHHLYFDKFGSVQCSDQVAYKKDEVLTGGRGKIFTFLEKETPDKAPEEVTLTFPSPRALHQATELLNGSLNTYPPRQMAIRAEIPLFKDDDTFN
ncbi:hypothetical protein KVT40_008658 [Elsinoe batatas]|uniref:Uncharacterized protein n=1 Tax=Elsinoe batatas TaxID=2601811 RepID=A0A8K0KUE7_9PEZI|nr:hypothetical protein KVT40_008658 [Elsinoe batatas]